MTNETNEPTDAELREATIGAMRSMNTTMRMLLEICDLLISAYRDEGTRFLIEDNEKALMTAMTSLQLVLSCVRGDRKEPLLRVVK